jgi:tRNA G10  N-methylase Trm11
MYSLNHLEAISLYEKFYYPKITNSVNVEYSKFKPKENSFDVVLTSPPYGDSKTTVAYGQFSTLSNEWLGIDYARKI